MSERQPSSGSTPPDPAAEQAAEQAEVLAQMREQLASVSAADLVAETAVPLVTLAYVRLGIPPEQNERYRDLDGARLLIDALGGLLDAAAGRLGGAEPELRSALASLRLAYADVRAHVGTGQPAASGVGPAGPAARPGQPAAPAAPAEPQPGRRPSGLWVPGQGL